MNKFRNLKKMGSVIALFILMTILSGCENSLKISNLTVNTTINEDGSVKMEEKIGFHFDDGKEAITKNIYFPDGSEVKDLVVSDTKGYIYKLVSSYANETSKVYTKTSVDKNLIALEIYSPEDVADETYNVTYTLANIATKYKDSGHFVWTYVGKGTDVSLGDVNVNINFQGSFDKSQVQVNLNGPLVKNVQVDNSGIKTSVKNFPTDTLYEVSVLFPNSYISKSNKVSGDTIKDKVETIENKWKVYDDARITNKKIHNYSMIGIFIISILFIIYFYIKFCRKTSKDEGFKLYKDLPSQASPAVVRRLLKCRIRTIDVAATAFDLVRRGHLSYLQDMYTFKSAQPVTNKDNVHEAFFITFFLNTIGKKRSLSIREIETKSFESGEAKKIRENYKGWKRKIDIDLAVDKELKLKSSSISPILISVLFSIIMILVTVILSLIVHKLSPMIVINILVQFFIIYFAVRRSKKFNEESLYDRYMRFKAFLKDKEALLEVLNNDISIAEKYLPYAISLGVYKEFMDILKNNIHSKEILGFDKLTYLKIDDEYYFEGISKVIDIIEGYLNKAVGVNNQ